LLVHKPITGYTKIRQIDDDCIEETLDKKQAITASLKEREKLKVD